MHINNPEVLSPAGSFEALEAAVRSGADAVYLGAKAFSARRNAENFDDNELERAVHFCHIRGVKVYLTLNIMVKQNELNAALETARHAYNCGIDGIIVQDIGLAKAVSLALPELPLHASTQMTVHSPAALLLLKEMGFCRVVAAREMSLKQLKLLCLEARRLDIEVEVFVHGALCMSVSGQCLLSSVLGARSGNRGLCAGPCRLPFSAKGGTGYDLSLKDLSLLEHIDELKEMGVSSFKIEGRMKRPEYIAAATAAFRRALDNGAVDENLNRLLKDVFSRSGFTDGYFTSTESRNMFGIRTKDDVLAAKESFSYIHDVYRTERQSIGIMLMAEILSGAPMKITLSDGENTVTVRGDTPAPAQKKAATAEDISDSLKKLGGTPYYTEDIEIRLDKGLFVPNSALNALRREAVDLLSSKRGEIKKRENRDYEFLHKREVDMPPQRLVVRLPKAELLSTLNGSVSAALIPISEITDKAAENGVAIIAELPRWIENDEALLKMLFDIKAMGIKKVFCSNLSAVALAKRAGLEIMGGMGLNVANSESIAVLEDKGVKELVLSPELEIGSAAALSSGIERGIFAYGRLPLMLLKSCPLKNSRHCGECDKKGFITDRKSISFPIECSGSYSEMLNSRPIFLADRRDEISSFNFLLLYFTRESAEEISEIISAYQCGGRPYGEYTRGLYYRNLI